MSTSTSREQDRALVDRLIEGYETAFEEFADRYIPALDLFPSHYSRAPRTWN